MTLVGGYISTAVVGDGALAVIANEAVLAVTKSVLELDRAVEGIGDDLPAVGGEGDELDVVGVIKANM